MNRLRRSLYALADPFLQLYYAVLEPHGSRFRDRDPGTVWERLLPTFASRVRGPVFEEQAREWVRRHAVPTTLGGSPDHVGPSVLTGGDREFELDVVAATEAESRRPADRAVLAIGEAKVGRTLAVKSLRRLEDARALLELVDLDRLYAGS